MMNVTIRKAVKEDCSRIIELVNELAVYERAPDEVTVTAAEFESAGFGPDAVWQAFVAVIDDRIEGFALYYTRFSTWKGRRLYLEDFLVTDKMRGKGIGKLLFETIITEAQTNDYNGMTWQVLGWNRPAINFYNKYQAVIEQGWLNVSISKERVNGFAGL